MTTKESRTMLSPPSFHDNSLKKPLDISNTNYNYQPLNFEGGTFRPATKFNPWKIIGQIVLFQLVFWKTIMLMQVLMFTTPSIIMNWTRNKQEISSFIAWPQWAWLWNPQEAYHISVADPMKSSFGFLNGLAFLLANYISGYHLYKIVGRSKLCLDFVSTCYCIHIFAVLCYTHRFPLNAYWWLLMLISSCILVQHSRQLCLSAELLPISTSIKSTNTASSNRIWNWISRISKRRASTPNSSHSSTAELCTKQSSNEAAGPKALLQQAKNKLMALFQRPRRNSNDLKHRSMQVNASAVPLTAKE